MDGMLTWMISRVLIALIPRRNHSMRRSVSVVDFVALPLRKKYIANVPFLVEPETAPTGMITRGHYNAVSKFVDDDNQTHLKFEWSFDIKKDW